MNGNKSVTANFTQSSYTLTIAATNGTVAKSPSKTSYNHGETVTLTATPAAGYNFSGWSGGLTGTANPATITMTANKTITAGFTAKTYTLSITSSNATVTKSPLKALYSHGDTVQLSVAPNTGYSFVNWSGGLTGSANPATVTMDGNKAIAAVCALNTYSLTVNAANGSVTRSPDQASYDYNASVTLNAVPAAGYTFTGWSGNLSGTANPATLTMNAAKTVTANFASLSYALAVSANNGSVAVSPAKSTYQYGEVVTLTATAASGYYFTGWSGTLSGSENPVTITIDGDESVTAQCALKTYSLTVNAANGSVARSPSQSTYPNNQTVTLTATPAEGYTFTGWSGSLSGSANPATITMTDNKTITANFSANTYSLSVTAPNAAITINPQKEAYSYGETVTLAITPNTGYSFLNWTGGLTGSANPATITIDENMTVTANCAADTYSLQVNAANGSVVRNPDQASYDYNTTVTLSASPNEGYHFTGWSGDLSGSTNPATITINAAKTITANYAVNTYTLSTTAGGGSITKNPDKNSYNHGESVTLTVIPAAGKTFSGWSGGLSGNANPAVITMNTNKTVTAAFTTQDYIVTADARNGGSIQPQGDIPVGYGGSQTFTFAAETGYQISQVLIDDISLGALTSYTFSNISADHTILVTFKSLTQEDKTAPTAICSSPQPNDIQVPLNTVLNLHVTDTGVGVDVNSIVITVEGNIVYTGGVTDYISEMGRCQRKGTEADYVFTYQPTDIFDFDHNVSITVTACDLNGNLMPKYSASFETQMRGFGGNKQVNISSTSNLAGNCPVTVRDSQGTIWVAWEAGAVGARKIYISKMTSGAGVFANEIPVSSSPYDQCHPALAIDNHDKLYLAWQQNSNPNGSIWFSASTDGITWSSPAQVDNTQSNQTQPAIAVDSQSPGQAYIAWQDDRAANCDIYLAVSQDDFITKTITPITTSSYDQTEPAIAIDSGNTVSLVWTETRNSSTDIYGAASNQGPWTNVPIVTGSGNQSSPAIAAEAEGTILHLLWVDDTGGDQDIYYAGTSGALAGTPLTGTYIIDSGDLSGADQFCPAITTSGSTGANLKIFACWQDNRNVLNNNGDSDIYFSEAEDDGQFGTNIWVSDSDTSNSTQSRPAMALSLKANPYLVWVDAASENPYIHYAGTTIINQELISTKLITAAEGGYVNAEPGTITSVNDICLEIPAGTFRMDTQISIYKVENPPASIPPVPLDIISSYEFGPSSNLEFNKPVTITIPYLVSQYTNPSVFWYNMDTGQFSQSAISNIEHIVLSSTLHAIRYKTTHFTQYVLAYQPDTQDSSSGGSGGGGGCSLSHYENGGRNGWQEIVSFFLPYLILAIGLLTLRSRRIFLN